MSVQRELFESEIALERRELDTDPEGERHEVAAMFRAKGIDEEDAERIADEVMAQPEVALDLMAREELGLNPDDLGSPWGAALSSFLAFSAGAAIPLLPYVALSGAGGAAGGAAADGGSADDSWRIHGAVDVTADVAWCAAGAGDRRPRDWRDVCGGPGHRRCRKLRVEKTWQ